MWKLTITPFGDPAGKQVTYHEDRINAAGKLIARAGNAYRVNVGAAYRDGSFTSGTLTSPTSGRKPVHQAAYVWYIEAQKA